MDKTQYVNLALNKGLNDWVLFSGGTFVVLRDTRPGDDLGSIATDFLIKNGEVQAGNASGDFMVTPLLNTVGWVVRGNVDGIYVYVHPSELANSEPDDLQIGLYARATRQNDYYDLHIVHINQAGL